MPEFNGGILKDLIIVIITLVGGYFIWLYQQKRIERKANERIKKRMFDCVHDLAVRRQHDLEAANNAFKVSVLVDKRYLDSSAFIEVSYPKRINVDLLEQCLQKSHDLFPINYREAIDVLIIHSHAINQHLDEIRTLSKTSLVLKPEELSGLHCQMLSYSYLVHELERLKERYVTPSITHQQSLEVAAKAFGLPLSPDEIVSNYYKEKLGVAIGI
ncbi:hypothetical protein [Vibrio vulnificus]|uniref:hypothetical protein n=1 Tax=Vibrio vulnificus TaxID=672 RepID=UPI0019D45D73|nr:hypothetical protein [Vibrio vulnificus]MBN8090832.1 hypothetical protein [Vibrio vulnificus]MBN8119771.1 hypothetical protein [Vibrio vulnificus]MDS1873159.1 hypothetical protein [Vibrio vulnificus]